MILGTITLMASAFLMSQEAADAGRHRFNHENVLGTSLEIQVEAATREAAQAAEARVLREIDRLDQIFSTYRSDSELARWMAGDGKPTRLSPELGDVLNCAEWWRMNSQGAFDARVETLTRLWFQCERESRAPLVAEIQNARERTRQPAWRASEQPGMFQWLGHEKLTLNAVAKGWIVERATEAAWRPEQGVSDVLVNLGGDLCHRGSGRLRLGLSQAGSASEAAPIAQSISIENASVATSGNAFRGFRINDRWYSHIIDPRDGWPVERVISASVIAPRGADADALATICNVLEPAESLKLVESIPGAACRVETRDGAVFQSARWPGDTPEQDAAPSTRPDPPVEGHWSETHELAIPFELGRPEAARYRRPYVVIWIENSEGISVRSLILWVSLGGSGPDQWLPDLARWYRGDAKQTSVQRKNMVQTMARPTRQPGEYIAVWDGKDDTGKLVPAGEYTVFIETAREHGTHELIRQPVTIGGKEFREELTGNVEIKSARIEYRRKSKPES